MLLKGHLGKRYERTLSCSQYPFNILTFLLLLTGGIHLSETKRRFMEGTLHPANVLMCPHTCITNLPKPREVHPDVGQYPSDCIFELYNDFTELAISKKRLKSS